MNSVHEKDFRCIVFDDGQLYSRRSNREEIFRIFPETENTFFYEHDRDLKVTFVAQDKHQEAFMLMYRPGREWKAVKETTTEETKKHMHQTLSKVKEQRLNN